MGSDLKSVRTIWASQGLHPLLRITMQMIWTCWFTKEMHNAYVCMGTTYKMSIMQQLPSIFLKCISFRNLLKTHSLSEPQPWLGFWSRKLAPYSNASLRETFLLLIFELKRKFYSCRLQISLWCILKNWRDRSNPLHLLRQLLRDPTTAQQTDRIAVEEAFLQDNCRQVSEESSGKKSFPKT